jgi:hypothetical protein
LNALETARMTKTTHTHTGNCQACGRRQAVDNAKGTIAKHGYVVDWNQFHGVCGGADRVPAQVSVDYTHHIITFCQTTARDLLNHAQALETGNADPKTCVHYDATIEWVNKYGTKRVGKNVEIDYRQGTTDEQKRARSNAINEARHNAQGNLDHATYLFRTVLPMYGTELMTAAEVKRAESAARAEKKARPSKAGFKRQLDTLNAQYHKLRRQLQDAYLTRHHGGEGMTSDATDLYYGAQDLHQWNAKWSKIALAVHPTLASTVSAIEDLVEKRKAVKAAQVAAGI